MNDQARDFAVLDALRVAAKIKRETLAREAKIHWMRFLAISIDPGKATPKEIRKIKSALDRLLQAMRSAA